MEHSDNAANPSSSSTHGNRSSPPLIVLKERASPPLILPKGPSLAASNCIYQKFKEAEAKFKSIAEVAVTQPSGSADSQYIPITSGHVLRPVKNADIKVKPIPQESVSKFLSQFGPKTESEANCVSEKALPKPSTRSNTKVKSVTEEAESKQAKKGKNRLKIIDQTVKIIAQYGPKAEGEVKSVAEKTVPKPSTRSEAKAKSVGEETFSKSSATSETKVTSAAAEETLPKPVTAAEPKVNSEAEEDSPKPTTKAEATQAEAEIKSVTVEELPQKDIKADVTKADVTKAEVTKTIVTKAEDAKAEGTEAQDTKVESKFSPATEPSSKAEAKLKPAANTDGISNKTDLVENDVPNGELETDKSFTEFEILTEVKEEPLENSVDVTSEAEEAEVDPEEVLDQIFDAAESGNSEHFSKLLFNKKNKAATDPVNPSRPKKRPRSKDITEEHNKLVEQLVSVRKSTRKRKIPTRCENEEIWETPKTAAKSKRRSVDFKNVKNTVKDITTPAQPPVELIDYSVLTSALTKTLKESLGGGENDVKIVIFCNNKPIQSFSLRNNINEVAGRIEETSIENGSIPSNPRGDIKKKSDGPNESTEKKESAEKKAQDSTDKDNVPVGENNIKTPSPLRNIRGFKKLSTSVKKNNTFLRIKGSYVSDLKNNRPLTPEPPPDADSDEDGERLVINTEATNNTDKKTDTPPAKQDANSPKQEEQVNDTAEPRKPFRVRIPSVFREYKPPGSQSQPSVNGASKTTGDFPFKCELCDKEFNLRRTLNRHKLRIHTTLTTPGGDTDYPLQQSSSSNRSHLPLPTNYTVSILGNLPTTIANQVEGSGEPSVTSAEACKDEEGSNGVDSDHDYITKNQGSSETGAATDQTQGTLGQQGAGQVKPSSQQSGVCQRRALLVRKTENGKIQVVGQIAKRGSGETVTGQQAGTEQLPDGAPPEEVDGLPVVTVKEEPVEEEDQDCQETTKEELFQDILTKGPLADILQSKNTSNSTKVNTLRNVIKRVENAQVAKGLDLPVDSNGEIQPVFVCEHCSKYYRSRKTLKDHFMREHATVLGDEPLYLYIAGNKYQCTVCFKYFHSASELLSHTKTHTGELQSPCNICGKIYSSVHVLRRHIDNVHAEVRPRPFRCQLCDYAASNKWHLKEHHRRHTGEQPFLCPICNKAFSHQGTMNRHCKTVHKFDSSSLSREQLRLQQGLSSLTVPSLQLTGSELTLADLSGPLTDPSVLQSIPLNTSEADGISSERIAELFAAAQASAEQTGDQSTGELINQSAEEQEVEDQSADQNSQSDSTPQQEAAEGNLPFLDMSIVKTEPLETF